MRQAYIKAYIMPFFRDQRGATAIEYGLMAAGVGIALMVAVFAFGDVMRDIFEAMTGSLEGAVNRLDEP